jgi:hypothetical protein
MNTIPTRKVAAGGVVGAMTLLIVGALHQFTQIHVSAETAISIQTVVAFVIAYLVPNADTSTDAASDDKPPA